MMYKNETLQLTINQWIYLLAETRNAPDFLGFPLKRFFLNYHV